MFAEHRAIVETPASAWDVAPASAETTDDLLQR